MYLDLEPWPLLVWLAFALQIVTAVPAVRIGMTAAFDAGPYLLELVSVHLYLRHDAFQLANISKRDGCRRKFIVVFSDLRPHCKWLF